MTMVASFMPSMAFAANTNDAGAGHSYYEYGVGNDYTIVDGKAVTTDTNVATKEASQKAIDKCVKVVVAPTCTTKGKVELTCKTALPDGVACDQVKTEEIEKLGHSNERVNMSLEAYAAQMVAQAKGASGDFENEGKAKAWVKTQKNANVCYVLAMRCKNCGAVVGYNATITPAQAATETGANSKLVNHGFDAATASATCADKVQCSNVGCVEMVANTTSHPGHDYDTSKATTTKTGCNGLEVVKTPCKNCDDVRVQTSGAANCVEFKGELAASAVKTKTTTSADNLKKTQVFLVDGKTIAKNVWTRESESALWGTATFTVEPGYKYDAENDLFIKADTTVDDNGTEKYGYTCKHCGYVTVGSNVTTATCVHAWTKVTVEATCEDYAKEYMVCTECGKYKKVTDADDVVGTTTKADAVTKVEGSKALGHNYVATKVEGDCHDTDSYTIKCSRENCTATKSAVTRSNYSTLEKGTSLYLVPSDGTVGQTNVVGSQELPYIADNTANNHKFTKKVTLKAATCTNNELVGYVCDTCGKINIHSAVVVPSTKLAHNFVKTEVAATCGKAGYSFEQCSVCEGYKNGNTTSVELVDACKTEIKPVVKTGAACTFDKWVVAKKATVFEEGVKSLECSVCGAAGDVKTVIAKAKYAAPAVKAGKKSATVTVKATEGAVSYKISYKKAGGSYKTVAAQAGKKTIKKLAKGKKYTFKVIAVNAEGVEVASATKTVKVK